MSQGYDWPMELNNYCQTNRKQMAWTQNSYGQQNTATWTVAVLIDGIEYGRGSGRSVRQAKAVAAEMALRALWASR
ncbi:hypothetical protein C8Q73DRAFT_788873 [Cubamyces lactineus]|nr:hypothetical protein C8Q73DRAFT_788873 [Cubamyces lactineus]